MQKNRQKEGSFLTEQKNYYLFHNSFVSHKATFLKERTNTAHFVMNTSKIIITIVIIIIIINFHQL